MAENFNDMFIRLDTMPAFYGRTGGIDKTPSCSACYARGTQ